MVYTGVSLLLLCRLCVLHLLETPQAPRGPSLQSSVTLLEAQFTYAYEGITSQSSLLQPHAPIPNPLTIFGSTLYGKSLLVVAIPAGSGTFPSLSLKIFLWMPEPLPRLLLQCILPFLPAGLRLSPAR